MKLQHHDATKSERLKTKPERRNEIPNPNLLDTETSSSDLSMGEIANLHLDELFDCCCDDDNDQLEFEGEQIVAPSFARSTR